MKTSCTCGQLNKAMSAYCENCGASMTTSSQFSKKSKNQKYTNKIIEGAKGYFISISDDECSHCFKQKEVKNLEEKTGLKRQELADFIASHTTSLSYHFNGKYGQSNIQYDIRTEGEKRKDEERIANFKTERIVKEKEKMQKKEIEKKEIKEFFEKNPKEIQVIIGTVEALGTMPIRKIINSYTKFNYNNILYSSFGEIQKDETLPQSVRRVIYDMYFTLSNTADNNNHNQFQEFSFFCPIFNKKDEDENGKFFKLIKEIEQKHMQS